MSRRGTSGQLFPLTTGANQAPSASVGGTTTFLCNSLPDRAPGGLAYYLNCVFLTFTGTYTVTGGSAAVVPWDKFTAYLFSSINWQNAWHGSVISPNFNRGELWPLTEYIKGGWKYAQRKMEPLPSAAAAYSFSVTVALYPSNFHAGDNTHNTAQLAALFKQSTIDVNYANSWTVTSGGVISNMTVRASALMEPRAELVLGTPVETVIHTIPAGSTSQELVQLIGFGRTSQLQGVQAKGGVISLIELAGDAYAPSVGSWPFNQPSLNSVAGITSYNFPWRNQRQTQDIPGYLAGMYQWQQAADRVATAPIAITGGDAEGVGFPFSSVHANNYASVFYGYQGMYGFPLVFPGEDVRFSDIQTADSDQEYSLSATFTVPGNHIVLAEYAKSWTVAAVKDWLQLVTANGDSSLAAYVLGKDNVSKATTSQRLPNKTVVTGDNMAYLPFQLAV